MSEHWTCKECDNLYDDTDGDIDQEMCNKCLNKLKKGNKMVGRIMVKDGSSIKSRVLEHIILKNFWEYYILEDEHYSIEDDIQWCYAMGFDDEYGTCSRSEMKPYIISQTKNLKEVMPPTGYSWYN